LTAEHWIDPEGKRPPIGALNVEEDEVLDQDALREIEPEEHFEGYTGNAGMTLDRWYRHAAVFLWPDKKHFEVLCDAGTHQAVQSLEQMVKKLRKAGKKEAATLREQGITFARAILARWPENPYGGGYYGRVEPSPLFSSLAALDEPGLIKAYLAEV